MLVIKRDGSKELFDLNKIIKAINSAFIAVNETLPQHFVDAINTLFSQF